MPPDSEATSYRPLTLGAALKDARVLLVEDDEDTLYMVKSLLELAGAQVTPCHSAFQALDVTGRFDVIISDIGMPRMDGYEFMRNLRAREEHATTPAVALTAYARPEDVERAKRAGYQDHVAKPIDATRLIEVVGGYLRSAKSP